MRVPHTLLFTSALLLFAAPGCTRKKAALAPGQLAAFSVLPDALPATVGGPLEERIALGRMLYYETRLSRNQKISCNSCHDLAKYGVDGEPTSNGHKGQRGDRNSPTVYNAAVQFVQFWDGRAPNVEEQAKGPMLNPIEMAMPSPDVVVATLRSMPEYVAAFRRAYPDSKDPVTYENAANAVGAFERKLLTPARWDKFLKGDRAALTAAEQEGLAAFLDAGCQTCHAGALLGGNLYQKIGLAKPYPHTADPGRFKVTGQESDRMMFKVPMLRNVARTGPYFHTGQVARLEDAVAEMGDYQLGKRLGDAEVRSIVLFLQSLTGEIPADYIKPPALPPSTVKTPKPEEAG
jgi:cytochrome c peroxidase